MSVAARTSKRDNILVLGQSELGYLTPDLAKSRGYNGLATGSLDPCIGVAMIANGGSLVTLMHLDQDKEAQLKFGLSRIREVTEVSKARFLVVSGSNRGSDKPVQEEILEYLRDISLGADFRETDRIGVEIGEGWYDPYDTEKLANLILSGSPNESLSSSPERLRDVMR